MHNRFKKKLIRWLKGLVGALAGMDIMMVFISAVNTLIIAQYQVGFHVLWSILKAIIMFAIAFYGIYGFGYILEKNNDEYFRKSH